MEIEAARRWNRTSAKGRARFVLLFAGVFAITYAVLSLLLEWAIDASVPWHHHVVRRVVIWALVGVGLGFWSWHRNERSYGAFVASHGTEFEEPGAP
jgi:hypothetical protein